ncbi:hypothetical protein Gotur_035403, partial [Gossypium turneri]
MGHMNGLNLVLSPCFHQLRRQCMIGQRRTENKKMNRKKVKPGQLNRAGLIMICNKYGSEGHNKRSCIQPNTTGTQ